MSANYLLVSRSHNYTVGDNYIIMSSNSNSDKDIIVETIHIVDNKTINELEERINVQLRRVY